MSDQVQAAIDAMTGRTILGGVLTDDGLHLWMDDGAVIVVLGVLAILEPEGTLQ